MHVISAEQTHTLSFFQSAFKQCHIETPTSAFRYTRYRGLIPCNSLYWASLRPVRSPNLTDVLVETRPYDILGALTCSILVIPGPLTVYERKNSGMEHRVLCWS